jgi:hypothetical protein
MRCGAGLKADQAWRQVLKELQNMSAPQFPAGTSTACGINTVDLKD